MRNFKFFKGIVGARVVSVGGVLNELNEPPFGISYRHWNLLPQDLRGGERLSMENYIEGWEAARHANYNNPYQDQLRGEMWNRGWHAWWERRNGGNVSDIINNE